MNRIDYHRAVLLGVVLGMSLLSFFYIVTTSVDVKEPEEPKSNFEVVDTYKSCDVVRYTDETQRWNYFLDCSYK